jgi:hypothetical protein
MKLEPATLADVHRQIDQARAVAGGDFAANYFRQELSSDALLAASTRKSVIFASPDLDFHRLYFFSSDLVDLGDLFDSVELTSTMVAEYLAKETDPRIVSLLTGAGFERYALFHRMTNDRLPPGKTNRSLELALPEDTGAIHRDLLETFDKFTDHLPTQQRLGDCIVRQQVLVSRIAGEIRGWAVFPLHLGRVHFNYLKSSGRPLDAVRLLANFYGLMSERSIRSGFLWVNDLNTGVIDMHRRFGWRFDGLRGHFFVRNRTKSPPE